MPHTNSLITFLRHYGPISASDNMYDELIQTEIERHGIHHPLQIRPAILDVVIKNFKSSEPRNIILTGTAGDGKTYHCRRIWESFGGKTEEWQQGDKIFSLSLQASSKTLIIIKDLSELTQSEKDALLPGLSHSVSEQNAETVYLIAANDGQLMATWRDWAETQGDSDYKIFKMIEDLLVEDLSQDEKLNLDLYNLSRLDASEHFQELIEQIVEHPQWSQCQGCELLNDDGSTTCPIRINRELLRGGVEKSSFRRRLGDLMKLSRANRMHLPIRDLLLLGTNIILGDRKTNQILLTCRSAKNRAKKEEYRLTNPYANVFGANLTDRQRQQYYIFMTLESFGIGLETDNTFDNLLIYGSYENSELYKITVSNDIFYGARAYEPFLKDYLEGERENIGDFMNALTRQRQRLFFTIPEDTELDPWRLTVYQSSGLFLDFENGLLEGKDVSHSIEILIRGLNRTFCGMMIDDGTELYLASSGGDGRGRIASLLDFELPTTQRRRDPYVDFRLAGDNSTPRFLIIDPASGNNVIDHIDLQLTHFEYLVRVANGSLPASFSRQCHEDFLDFKIRVIKRLERLIGESPSPSEVSLQAFTVSESGRVQPDNIRIRVGA